MIKKICINNIATYTNPTILDDIKKINFVYGCNGSGKSTLVEYIENPLSSSDSQIEWENNQEIPVFVYNKKFIDDKFGESSKLDGIFTLGEETKEARDFIEKQRELISQNNSNINDNSKQIETIEKEIETITLNTKEICWKWKEKYVDRLPKVFEGYGRSKDKFLKLCLEKYETCDDHIIPDFNNITENYNVAFGTPTYPYDVLKIINIEEIEKFEICQLLGVSITGSSETEIGKFIKYLNNSDWVKHGISYSEKAEGKCPYCQRSLPESIQEDIRAFFDETYVNNINILSEYQRQYNISTSKLRSDLESILDNKIPNLDYRLFESEIDTISSIIDENKEKIQNKLDSPSVIFEIQSIVPIITQINETLSEFNITINKYNNIVQNRVLEREKCRDRVWQLMVYDLKPQIAQYHKNLTLKYEDIENLTNEIKRLENNSKTTQELINKKIETIVSVAPTVLKINKVRISINPFF